MRRVLLIISFLFVSIDAELLYHVNASLLGKIGEVRVTSKQSKHSYSIKLDIKTTGIARRMSGNLLEHHSSKGYIKNGQFYAREYTVSKSYEDMKYLKKYKFDYSKKKIKKTLRKWQNGKLVRDSNSTLDYFSHNDIMTLYHNIRAFEKKNKAGAYSIWAAGAERVGGKSMFVLPTHEQKSAMLDEMSLDNSMQSIKLFLSRAYFSGSKGNIIFGIDKKGITKRATLNNLKLFGTVSIDRVK